MSCVEKRVLSQYLRLGCNRFLYFSLHRKKPVEGILLPLKGRPGLAAFKKQGLEFERTKFEEISAVFGDQCCNARNELESKKRGTSDDEFLHRKLTKGDVRFLIEPTITEKMFAPVLTRQLALPSAYPDLTDLRPDIIEVMREHKNRPLLIVSPNGSVSEYGAGKKIPLRVIDLKAAEKLNTSYAAEVVAYSMALAAWLAAMGLDRDFVVSAEPAIWTKNVFNQVRTPLDGSSMDDKLKWVEGQLEKADIHLYGPSVIKFLAEDVVNVLSGQPWHELDWGVSSTCSMCDYLGYPGWSKSAILKAQEIAKELKWNGVPKLEDYCYLTAKNAGLAMQIPSLTTGMRRTLTAQGVTTLSDVSRKRPDDPAFEEHSGLKIESKRLPMKAKAIIDQSSSYNHEFKSAGMAKYSNLTIAINVSFDAASNMLTALGLGIDFTEPVRYGSAQKEKLGIKKVTSFLVDRQTDEAEREQLMDFLNHIATTLDWIQSESAYKGENARSRKEYTAKHATVQVVFWDEIQEKALRDAIGRHLDYIIDWNRGVFAPVWLFPPDEMEGSDRTADCPPVCHLKDIVTKYPILPTTVSDDLVTVAETLLENFQAKLSDYQWDRIGGAIPKERALEIWLNMPPKTPPKSIAECKAQYIANMSTLVHAMRQIIFHFRINHKHILRGSAPLIKELPPTAFQGVAPDSLLWLTHQGVEEGSGRLEKMMLMSSDPYELECRHMALRTQGQLTGKDREKYLNEIGENPSDGNILTFRISKNSRHVKYRNEDGFLTLLPEAPAAAGLMSVDLFVRESGAGQLDYDQIHWIQNNNRYRLLCRIMGASLLHFDRQNLWAAITFSSYFRSCLKDLIRCTALDLDKPMVLLQSFGVPQIKNIQYVAKAIGNPPIATPSPELAKSLPNTRRKAGKSKITPAARVLWEPEKLVQMSSGVQTDEFYDLLDSVTSKWPVRLNDAQREGARNAIDNQLSLTWGGPGTGKTRTLVAAIITDVLLRMKCGVPARTFVTAHTYRALKEIILRLKDACGVLPAEIRETLWNKVSITFVLSTVREDEFADLLVDGRFSGLETITVNKWRGKRNGEDDATLTLSSHFERIAANKDGGALVFGVTRQAYNLITGCNNPTENTLVELFDRIWLDESSQVAVAEALPLLGLLAENGSFGLVGDRLQMPPIQSVPPPKGSEDLVGSLHRYLFSRILQKDKDFKEGFLNINYRSCEPIVSVSRAMGYEDSFEAADPARSLDHIKGTREDADWDLDAVPHVDLYESILDPVRPCVAVTYDDGKNGQANTFEGTLVAGTVLTYRAAQKKRSPETFDEAKFWEEKIGVVTPHRAQRAVIVSLLQRALEGNVDARLIDSAVDTVERFQGSERDVILISFGLGDPDLIQKEEEFLFQKERINVAITRAKSKVALFVTRDLGYYLPTDPMIVTASRAIKDFVYQHLRHEERATVTVIDKTHDIRVRYRTYGEDQETRLT